MTRESYPSLQIPPRRVKGLGGSEKTKKRSKNLVKKKSMTNFAPQSPDGGIGRRVGLKHRWSNPCRFDPGSGY